MKIFFCFAKAQRYIVSKPENQEVDPSQLKKFDGKPISEKYKKVWGFSGEKSCVHLQTQPNSKEAVDMGGRGNKGIEEQLEDNDGSSIQQSIDGRTGLAG